MTKEQEQFIIDNYRAMKRQEMAHIIGCSKTIVDRFMHKNDLRVEIIKKKCPIKDDAECVDIIKRLYKTKTIKEISQITGYNEQTLARYIDRYHNETEEKIEICRKDLKLYYNYMKNLFDSNKVAVGRVKTNFRELMALARLKKEGLIELVREGAGSYTVILD